MKKLILILLAAVMCLSFAACGGGNDASRDNEQQINESAIQQEAENNTPNIVEVELTVDNFDTYFEFVEVPIFGENAFGEAEKFDVYQYYLVREEYSISEISDFAVEFEYKRGFRVCDVDFANRTYVFGDFTTTPETYSDISEYWITVEIDGQKRFGFDLGGINTLFAANNYNETGHSFDHKILRINGTLSIIEE